MLDKKQMAASQALPSGHGGGPLAAAQALAEGCRLICDLQGQCEEDGR